MLEIDNWTVFFLFTESHFSTIAQEIFLQKGYI